MTGLRYFASGGEIIDATGRQIPLAEARANIGLWSYKALEADALGLRHLARLYAAPTAALIAAVDECIRWRKAAGYARPEDADGPIGARR